MFGGSDMGNNLETAKVENFQENAILRRSPINKCGNITYLSKENIERDITNIPRWLFSCYGPVYDQDNIISGVEYSPEELRHDFYYETRNQGKNSFQSNKKTQDLQQSVMRQLVVIRQDLNKVIFQYRQATGYKGPILPINAPPQCISTDKTFGQVLQQAIQRRSENKNSGAHSSMFKSSTDVTGSQESAAFWGNTFSNGAFGSGNRGLIGESALINSEPPNQQNAGNFNSFKPIEISAADFQRKTFDENLFGGGSSAFGGGKIDPSGAWSTFSQSQYAGSQKADLSLWGSTALPGRGGFAQFASPNSGFGGTGFGFSGGREHIWVNGSESQATAFDANSMDIDSPTTAANIKFSQRGTPLHFVAAEPSAAQCSPAECVGGRGLSTENKLSKGYTFKTDGGKEQEKTLAEDIQLTIGQFEAFCFDTFEIGNIPLQPPPFILIKQL